MAFLLSDPFSWDQQNFCRACQNETVTYGRLSELALLRRPLPAADFATKG